MALVPHCDVCDKPRAEHTRRIWVQPLDLPKAMNADQRVTLSRYMADISATENRSEGQRNAAKDLCDDCFLIWLDAVVKKMLRSTSETVHDLLVEREATAK